MVGNSKGDPMNILAFEYDERKGEYRAMVEQDGKAVVLEGRFMSVALAEDSTALHAFLERQLAETNMLPCPFCGGTNICADFDYGIGSMATWCDDCGADGPQLARFDALAWAHTTDENRAYAIRLWNTRAVTLTPIHE